jgi:hypothetical protein
MRENETVDLLLKIKTAARVIKPLALGPIGADACGADFDGYIVGDAVLRVGRREP